MGTNTKGMFKKDTEFHHMGQIAKKRLKEQKMSVCEFAKAIHCSRTNVYSIFGRQSIDIDRLKQIAHTLKLDISDFLMMEKGKEHKYIAVIEIDDEKLNQLLNEDLTYIKYWKMK